MQRFPAAVFLTALLVIVGCNAPHDNPLDPASSRYRGTPSAPPDLTGRVRSRHLAGGQISDIYSVIAELRGSFAPHLDTAWIRYDNRLNFELAFDTVGQYWHTGYSAVNFGDSRLGNIIGRPFVIIAQDSQGTGYEVGPCYVWRVIDDVPVCVTPDSLHTVIPRPQFEWQAPTEIYPVAYQIQLYQVVIDSLQIDSLVWLSPDIPNGVNSITYPDSLPDGHFEWTVTMLDSFQNEANSVEAEFRVSHSIPL